MGFWGFGEGLETFLGIRDLEIYILLIYMVTRLQNYRTYRLLALFQKERLFTGDDIPSNVLPKLQHQRFIF